MTKVTCISESRVLLGRVHGANCRHEYGLHFMKLTGQTHCAYCDMDLATRYADWLQMALDHVVPSSICMHLGIQKEWVEDCANRVLACATCNGFGNRYMAGENVVCPTSLEGFFDLRDAIFAERKVLIAQRHVEERAFFAKRLWEQP